MWKRMAFQNSGVVLSDYLNASRGLQTTFENILVTRGTQMALYPAVASCLFSKGDTIIVGETNYYYADHVFLLAGMQLARIKVDEYGIDVEAIEKLCRRKKDKGIVSLPRITTTLPQ